METLRSAHVIGGVTLVLVQGNIVELKADAIVSAANAELIGGGGVDGAIHRAAGQSIMEECRKIGGCPTGRAVATTAGRLDATYIFHAVGPIYGYHTDAAHLLARAYQSCLNLAEQYHVKSMAFPSLSTGAYGYPIDQAAPIALKTVLDHIQHPTELQQVLFVLFRKQIYQAYEQALAQLLSH
jgi:O-acetyl-ADP-ribose deacetylase (regulator of RNase III)